MRLAAALVTAIVMALAASAATGGRDAFKPLDGRYTGHIGTAAVRVDVGGFLRPDSRQLPAVRLVKWSAKLRCPGHRAHTESTQMSAARIGRDFSGYTTFPGGKLSFEGTFTRLDALRATVRVKRTNGSIKCDTGAVRFSAKRR